jgi:hypothetical protein
MTKKLLMGGHKYECGIDYASGVEVVDQIMRPTAEHPHGSWLHKVGDEVQIATGHFAAEHPGKPSPYFHDGPPFLLMDLDREWPWQNREK